MMYVIAMVCRQPQNCNTPNYTHQAAASTEGWPRRVCSQMHGTPTVSHHFRTIRIQIAALSCTSIKMIVREEYVDGNTLKLSRVSLAPRLLFR